MFKDDMYLPNGALDIQGLDAKINSSFDGMRTHVNGLMDVRITKQLLGAQLVLDQTGDLRRLFFFLIMIDAERRKDKEILSEDEWKENSYYIELYNTEKLRDYYLCILNNSIVNYLFSVFELDYNNPVTSELIGIENMSIEGTEVPFKIY